MQQEKKAEPKNPRKANLSDHHSIKHALDEYVSENIKSRGYVEDTRMSNVKLLFGTVIIIIALLSQFYKRKFPENRDFYVVFSGILQLIMCTREKNAILFAYAPVGSFKSIGLVVSSKLPRFSDLYTLTVSSSDPKSKSANKPLTFTKSVTQWFTKDGVLAEGLFWKDVNELVQDYAKEAKKNK
ncbi:hypothetical protein L6164_024373 [Bauhinia variegata]|uniref:Uncharacterized protein n=1 Tax=Bauhinia variegata TaxID=167791 RepID=A0ACB9LY94_BAUVA|nr:hypothetical protein L6164_024373 [Bauhinia variegata]